MMSLCVWAIILAPLIVAFVKMAEKKTDAGDLPIFPVTFGIVCGIFGYIITPAGTFLKSGAMLSLALVGFFVAVFLQFLLRALFRNKTTAVILVELILFAVLCVFTFTRDYATEAPKSYDSDYSYSGSSSSSSSHSCYVCGKSASRRVGSHYYCSKHASQVQAGADVLDKYGY